MLMQPNGGEVLKRMVAADIETASGLATAAGVSRNTATKIMRGEKVSLSVASKVNEAIGGGRDLGELFQSAFEVSK